MLGLLVSWATLGYVATGGAEERPDGAPSWWEEVIAAIQAAALSVGALLVVLFGGLSLLLYLGVGDQLVKPVLKTVEGYFSAVFGFFGSLVEGFIP